MTFLVGAGTLLTSACERREPQREQRVAEPVTAAPVPKRANPTLEARNVYAARCTACHGSSGEGDGPGSAALDPKPRNFKDAEWQASVDDDRLGKVIVEGGTVAKLSPLMPGNPDLRAKPEVVTELVRMVRKFKP